MCDVDLGLSGAVTLDEQGTFRGVISDPRDPEAWTVFVHPHNATATIDGAEVEIAHSLQLTDYDGARPDPPLVVWRYYVIPSEPTPTPVPSVEPSGIGMIDTPLVTFFHYQWLAAVPSDRTLPPTMTLPPATGQAAFNGPSSATFDVTFNFPSDHPDAPKGELRAAGSIDCVQT
jgi:hypothetical protein